jgi:hypothetical protein
VGDLPFALEPGGRLVLRLRVADGVVFAPAGDTPAHDPRLTPVLTVAWLAEPPGITLDDVVGEDLARGLSAPGSVLLDREPVTVGGIPAVRTFALHRAPDGLPTASEHWRAVTAGRRWTVTAVSALADQPRWGPLLAAIAVTWRPEPA